MTFCQHLFRSYTVDVFLKKIKINYLDVNNEALEMPHKTLGRRLLFSELWLMSKNE